VCVLERECVLESERERECVCVLARGWSSRAVDADDDVPASGNVNRFRGGLVFKANRLVYHTTLGLRVIQKK